MVARIVFIGVGSSAVELLGVKETESTPAESN